MSVVAQPAGTVTLVFTDIEGSTRLLEELGVDAYRDALAKHRMVVREACARHAGYEVHHEGDAFFYAFASALQAVRAVSDAMIGAIATAPRTADRSRGSLSASSAYTIAAAAPLGPSTSSNPCPASVIGAVLVPDASNHDPEERSR